MHEIDMMLKLQLEGRHEEARALSDKLEQIGPYEILDPHGKNTEDIWMRHCFNRGWFLIQQGDYQGGCKLLENGRFLNVYGSGQLKTNAPIFNPKEHDIKGKSIIISLEGGFGDEIIHARFATSFKKNGADKVYLAAAPELVSILSRIEGVDGVILRNEANTVAHDFWVPGFSAGWIAGHTFDNFPGDAYLSAIPDSVEIWKNLITAEDHQVKVGIRWAGNPKFEHQQFRRFPENFMLNLSKYPELKIFSLQRDNNLVNLPENVTDLQHMLISWEDTAAAIMNLDLVITSCTSVAHLSAALGKETWIVVPCLPYHTWTYGAPDSTTSPYYKTVKLYRQKESSKWNEPFQAIYKDLEERFALEHIDLPSEDKVYRRLNLGCGINKIDGYTNVDKNEAFEPDVVFDLAEKNWPFEDNEFTHVVAGNVLEYVGKTKDDLINCIKEMYRISENGGVWEIKIPHWNNDQIFGNIDLTQIITIETFQNFNRKYIFEKAKVLKEINSTLAFDHDIDIEVVDVQFEFSEIWKQRMKDGVSQDEIMFALNSFKNVAKNVMILVEIHKPVRFSKEDTYNVLKMKIE